ncbi:hypothetical protein IFM89_031580 [Coptis chinensis]|uniref:Peptidase M48 domain-containing protein n=1 Tax=Coptis chinensis TaxID=261450 RepID=A0A835HPZ5_9MAGN|nr:hypothetical protein IFM89_031580 [Coptis chinensis]
MRYYNVDSAIAVASGIVVASWIGTLSYMFCYHGTLQALTDGEVSAVIAHEVGHVVARHLVEFQHMLLNRRKRELEAYYIGLLLMASARYNPRIAVELWKNISLSYPDFSKGDHEHPSVEERANSLAQAHVMEQALTIYKEVTPRRPVN